MSNEKSGKKFQTFFKDSSLIYMPVKEINREVEY